MEIDKRSNLEQHLHKDYSVIHHQQILYQNHLKYISP